MSVKWSFITVIGKHEVAYIVLLIYIMILFKKVLFIYFFLERGRGWERGGEKHQCVVASHAPPTGDLTHNPGMCPDWESNQWPFVSQAGTQSTEPHQPGLFTLWFLNPYSSGLVVKKDGFSLPVNLTRLIPPFMRILSRPLEGISSVSCSLPVWSDESQAWTLWRI